MTLRAIETRFRAYQLDSAGGSFSYFADGKFTLIESRITDLNESRIKQEMAICGVSTIDVLHITSWDQDHCSPQQLDSILTELKPRKIEYPGYEPDTDCGKESIEIIKAYKRRKAEAAKIVSITPAYIEDLNAAEDYGYNHIFYHPRYLDDECHNNNSTVKQFRSGSFNVLSLGDVESSQVSAGLRRLRTIHSEADIMVLAHHGAHNGFTTSGFLKQVKPSVAIASSNYGNQFDHPKPEIRELLHKHDIELFTTKTGDVVIRSIGNHTGHYEVINLKADSTEVSCRRSFTAKKREFLLQNADTIRSRINRPNRGPR